VNEYGYNTLKRFGIQAGLTGVLVAATAVGVGYAVISESRAARSGRLLVFGTNQRGLLFVAVAFVALTSARWPCSGRTSIPTTWDFPRARHASQPAGGYLVAYLIYAVLLVATYGFVTRPSRFDQPAATPPDLSDPVHGAQEDRSLSPRKTANVVLIRQPVPRRAILATALGRGVRLAVRPSPAPVRGRRDVRLRRPPLQWAGIEPITPQDKFYTVTKNTLDPDVDRDIWRLEVNGHVERTHTYDFEELSALAAVTQLTTLMCISNHVSAGLMSNAEWRGVPMADLLNSAGVKSGAVEVVLRGADGYTDTFAIDKALDPTTLVVYEINGEPLSRIHGFPVRIVVPGLFGEKNVKWVTGIEVVTRT
jgi:DMSO/TMAO reductase YedYZ molybdopterin-dependent catalytic subunit